jgi:molybdenum cofactor cytidylyltransferase
MIGSLAQSLGIGRRELVAFTGAGGKSTLMLRLAEELADSGHRVLVTTTTKMGRNQVIDLPAVCQRADLGAVSASLASHPFVALVTGGDDHKVTGPPPEVIDELFRSSPVDYVLVEADGAHGRSLKAPASHEPVIPSGATTVVVLMGLDAVGGRIVEVAHRPESAAAITGLKLNDRLEAEHCVTVLTHSEGGLKGVPPAARVVVALITTGTLSADQAATRIIEGLGTCGRISDVVLV